jgi:hypothetical protein
LFRKEVVKMSVKIIKASTKDSEIISKLHALSWKTAYKGIVPQEYLDELKYDFWVDAFQNWISNNILRELSPLIQLRYSYKNRSGEPSP